MATHWKKKSSYMSISLAEICHHTKASCTYLIPYTFLTIRRFNKMNMIQQSDSNTHFIIFFFNMFECQCKGQTEPIIRQISHYHTNLFQHNVHQADIESTVLFNSDDLLCLMYHLHCIHIVDLHLLRGCLLYIQ